MAATAMVTGWHTILNLHVQPLILTVFHIQGSEYSGRAMSIPWLLMPWLLASPGHRQPWYWICNINGSFTSSLINIQREIGPSIFIDTFKVCANRAAQNKNKRTKKSNYSLFFTSRQAVRTAIRPATATGLKMARSLWYGLTVRVPLPRWHRPWAIRTQNRLLGSLAWYTASWRSMAARRALFVPRKQNKHVTRGLLACVVQLLLINQSTYKASWCRTSLGDEQCCYQEYLYKTINWSLNKMADML